MTTTFIISENSNDIAVDKNDLIELFDATLDLCIGKEGSKEYNDAISAIVVLLEYAEIDYDLPEEVEDV